jgi:hypothetical protein
VVLGDLDHAGGGVSGSTEERAIWTSMRARGALDVVRPRLHAFRPPLTPPRWPSWLSSVE